MLKNDFQIDIFNERIVSYILHSKDDAQKQLLDLEEKNNVGKSIIYTTKELKDFFINSGYIYEGKINEFFLGEDAYILSKFKKPSRGISTCLNKDEILDITHKDKKNINTLSFDDTSFRLECLTNDHQQINDLCSLYSKVFSNYPVDITNPEYLANAMGENYLFVVAKDGNKIISAASAMINGNYNCAEITDCVTDPNYRGKNLLAFIIVEIEKLLRAKKVNVLYSLTRAESIGMNLNIKRLGYIYDGTLLNNCIISSGFEDMNIWGKVISE